MDEKKYKSLVAQVHVDSKSILRRKAIQQEKQKKDQENRKK